MYNLYVIQEERDGFVKIGYSQNVEDRLKQLQSANPAKLSILYTKKYTDPVHARAAEEGLHFQFRHTRLKGEWFRFTDYMKKFFETWNGDHKHIEFDMFQPWQQINEAISQIFHSAMECCDAGDFPAAEDIVRELDDTVHDIKTMIPGAIKIEVV